ncbi:MAG TPA: glycosyltransferase [Streptosporangiaceae bacterium]|nr:glycosyltransferase [Streptosporangiaceae bacterium]
MFSSSPPRVSIVIPTYNRSELLARQLGTLARQRFPHDDMEVVVADDGSSDATRQVVASFEPHLRLKYHFQEDLGFRAAAARNAGARLAAAPVLILLDAGTLVGPDYVGAHLAAHDGPERAGAAGPGRVVLGYTYGYSPWDPFDGLADALDRLAPEEAVRELAGEPGFQDMRHRDFARVGYDLSRFAAPWMYFWTVNMSLRAEDLRAAGGFDEDFRGWGGEDLEFGYRLTRAGLTPVVSRDAWAIEPPHERDLEANSASNRANAWLLWDKHPDPVMELYGAMYSRGRWDPPLEHEYGELLEWTRLARDLDVRDEIAAACARLPDAGGRAARVVVLGSGGALPPSPAARPIAWTPVDFDRDLLEQACAGTGRRGLHAIGVRTVLPDGAADLVVVSSRLAGLWDRWGEDILAEAHRIGRRVRVPHAETSPRSPHVPAPRPHAV